MENTTIPTAILDLSHIVITEDTSITDVIHEEKDFESRATAGVIDIYVPPTIIERTQSSETITTEITTVAFQLLVLLQYPVLVNTFATLP